MASLARYAWLVLAGNIAVIGWGAYVRATGSGAGCGNHWPLCNGEIVPRGASTATLIEFSHRATSGLALLAIAVLVAWTFRVCRRGHPARVAASLSGVLILTEAAVGAGLVLFQLVADNATMARAMFMAVHLLNTFLLLGALALTAWCLSVTPRLSLASRGSAVGTLAFGCGALLITGASGAVAALGDTLFPAASVTEGFFADLSASSHLLIRLRVLHPVLAVVAAAAVVVCSRRLSRGRGAAAGRGARVVTALTFGQLALGFLNVVLLAPVWLQLCHLLVADAIWIGFVLIGAEALTVKSPSAAPARAA